MSIYLNIFRFSLNIKSAASEAIVRVRLPQFPSARSNGSVSMRLNVDALDFDVSCVQAL